MKANIRERDGIVILDIKGRIEGGSDADYFHRLIKGFIAEEKTEVLVNLAKVNWINSPGLGILLGGRDAILAAGGQFKIAGISDRIRSILMISRLINVFETHENEAEAVPSFSEPAQKRLDSR